VMAVRNQKGESPCRIKAVRTIDIRRTVIGIGSLAAGQFDGGRKDKGGQTARGRNTWGLFEKKRVVGIGKEKKNRFGGEEKVWGCRGKLLSEEPFI